MKISKHDGVGLMLMAAVAVAGLALAWLAS